MAKTWARTKDPDEVLDYGVNWADPSSDALAGDTISTSSWIVPSGIVKDSDGHTPTTTTIWLSGGTVGETYEFVNRVVTAGARTMDQTVKLKLRNR